jgi:ribosomal protein L11 methyltransferase
VIVVVATAVDELAAVRSRLAECGVGAVQVAAPSPARRVVLATVHDDGEAERLAVLLRAEGWSAVTRSDDGARLEAWMRDTRPMTFGERLSVCFAWSEHDRAGLPGLIELGAGGFGSGQHPSTRLVIERLVERIAGGERVLDVGCGSGVLGLCALELGASSLVATDIKPAAIEATERNAALNGMEERVLATDAPLADLRGWFDVVVANVGRATLVELAPALVDRVAPSGWLATSGFSSSQCSLVAGFLRPLVEIERQALGEWSCLVFTHGERQRSNANAV